LPFISVSSAAPSEAFGVSRSGDEILSLLLLFDENKISDLVEFKRLDDQAALASKNFPTDRRETLN
jgi:hypothetical protein